MSHIVPYYTLFDEFDKQGAQLLTSCEHCKLINASRVDGKISRAAQERFYQGNVPSRDACTGCYEIHAELVEHGHAWFDNEEQVELWATGFLNNFEPLGQREAERPELAQVAKIFAQKIADKVTADHKANPKSWFSAKWQAFNVARGQRAIEYHECRRNTQWPQALQSHLFNEAFHESNFLWYSDETKEIVRYPNNIAYDVQLPALVTPTIERIARITEKELDTLLHQQLSSGEDRYLRWKILPSMHTSPFRHQSGNDDFHDWYPEVSQIGVKILFWKSLFRRS